MKKLKTIYKALIIFLIVSACTEEDRSLDFLENIAPPSNVAATYNLTQDNSGLVTITPTADGTTMFDVDFGDSSPIAEGIEPGKNVQHTYAEGSYNVKIIAYNSKGDAVEATQDLVVSFKAPQNLVATIENDAAVSKKVNVTATAEFAATYEFYSGETGVDQPVATANIGEALSYQYATAGTYSVKVVAMGGAIETTEYTVDFEVTEILAPIASAGTPPARNDADVISLFSDAYTDITDIDYNPNWGQQTIYTAFDLAGDAMIQYSNLNYQGIDFANNVQDASSMETLHIDIWTADATSIDIYPISSTSAEYFVTKQLVVDQWNSFEIPLSEFTDQGLVISDLKQFKFVGSGSVFIDNLYFHKPPSSGVSTLIVQDFEGAAPAFTDFGNIAPIEVVANPDTSGINSTSLTAKMVKSAGAETWAGAFFDVATPIDPVNYNKITIKTYTAKTGATVRFKMENSADNTQFHEVDATTTVANGWEELSFDISSANTAFTYDRLVIFFDFGNSGDDTVYYYDEVTLVNNTGGGSNPAVVFQDFEGTAPAFTDFGNIAPIEVVANPDASGENTTSMVAKLVKSAGAETWAGAFFDGAALDVANYSKVTVKTYSPKSGATVRFKIENSADNTQFVEVDATTSVVNGWEELTFDISSASASITYDRIVIFFDFGNSGDDSIYYYDELALTN
ncbi:PKD domain protein [uncultured Polaribacter sp.]|uniref:PKD domain protein n=1 Tax=uncultured Polaribacter sp. TaxID=174711 RepID=UPI00262BAA33|nr:PKD domain protein [uncultured Polaribacter sp.]